jgi:hypothetical protein
MSSKSWEGIGDDGDSGEGLKPRLHRVPSFLMAQAYQILQKSNEYTIAYRGNLEERAICLFAWLRYPVSFPSVPEPREYLAHLAG